MTLQTEIFNIRIHFSNSIISNRRKIKGEQNLQYNLTIWKKNDDFDILNDVSEYITLVHLMDPVGNFNHAISIVRYYIFDSNYKKALFLTQELLDIICSIYIGEELVATFQSVLYAIRYSWEPGNLKEERTRHFQLIDLFRKREMRIHFFYIVIFDNYRMKNYI